MIGSLAVGSIVVVGALVAKASSTARSIRDPGESDDEMTDYGMVSKVKAEETKAAQSEEEDDMDVTWKEDQIEKQQMMVAEYRGVMSIFSPEVFSFKR